MQIRGQCSLESVPAVIGDANSAILSLSTTGDTFSIDCQLSGRLSCKFVPLPCNRVSLSIAES